MTADAGRPRRDRPGVAVTYAIAANAVGGLPVWVVSAYAPSIQADLGFDDSQLGLALGIYFAFSTATGLPVGRLVQNWGWRAGIAFSSAVSALCIASMSSLAYVWIVLVLTLCIGALSNNSSQPAANLAIAATVPPRRQGLAFGLKQAALPLSTVLVGLSVPFFASGAQWRAAFMAASGCAILLALVVLVRPAIAAARGWRLDGRSARRAPRAPRGEHRYRIPKALVLLAIGAGFGTAAVVSLGGFLVVFSVQAGFTPGQGGALLAAGSLVGVIVRVLSGYLADRRGRRHLVVVAAMMAAGSVGFVCLALYGTTGIGLIAGTLFTFGLGWSWNGLLHFAVIRYIAIPAAVATSVVQSAMSLGSAIGPTLFGFVSEWAFSAAWVMAAVFLAVASVFTILARRALPRRGAGTAPGTPPPPSSAG